jgi:hypothetical protein
VSQTPAAINSNNSSAHNNGSAILESLKQPEKIFENVNSIVDRIFRQAGVDL